MPAITRSRTSVLLVNYAGYPVSPNSFMPDNGLATLAAQLKAAGHQAKILDYATISGMKRLAPPAYRQRLAKILRTFGEIADSQPTRLNQARQAKAFLELKVIAKALARFRRGEERKIADEIAPEARQTGAEMIAFKLWNGDGFSGPVRMAEILKQRLPGILVAAGGPQSKFYRGRIFEVTSAFDALAFGDGEATILDLAEVPLGRGLDEVANIVYLRDGSPTETRLARIRDMDGIPFPLYDTLTYPAMAGNEKILLPVIEDRRGCENLCNFCVHPSISGMIPRSKGAERVVNEAAKLLGDYGISSFRLGGSSSPGKLLVEIAREIQRRGLKIDWTAFSRVKDAKPEAFGFLKEQGLFSLFFGAESGNQTVLDALGKNVAVSQVESVMLAAKAAGIFTVGSIIYPGPFETSASRYDTLQLLKRVRPDAVPLSFLGIYPGTEYARNPGKYNLEIVYPSPIDNLLVRAGLKKQADFDSPEVTRCLMNYKLQLLFPPKFWKPLPWRINGLRHKEFAAETQKFYEELKREGILTMLTDEEALMAHHGGYQPKEFADRAFDHGFTGNAEGMAELVSRVNAGILQK